MSSSTDKTRRQALKSSRTVVTATLPPSIQHVLFYAPSFRTLAKEIMSLPGSSDFIAMGKIEWKKFEDGFPNLMINDVENIRGMCLFVF